MARLKSLRQEIEEAESRDTIGKVTARTATKIESPDESIRKLEARLPKELLKYGVESCGVAPNSKIERDARKIGARPSLRT